MIAEFPMEDRYIYVDYDYCNNGLSFRTNDKDLIVELSKVFHDYRDTFGINHCTVERDFIISVYDFDKLKKVLLEK